MWKFPPAKHVLVSCFCQTSGHSANFCTAAFPYQVSKDSKMTASHRVALVTLTFYTKIDLVLYDKVTILVNWKLVLHMAHSLHVPSVLDSVCGCFANWSTELNPLLPPTICSITSYIHHIRQQPLVFLELMKFIFLLPTFYTRLKLKQKKKKCTWKIQPKVQLLLLFCPAFDVNIVTWSTSIHFGSEVCTENVLFLFILCMLYYFPIILISG